MLHLSPTSLFLPLIFALVFSPHLQAQVPIPETNEKSIVGTLVKVSTPHLWLGLRTATGHVYSLRSGGDEVNETLPKLEDGDFVSGLGETDDTSKVAVLKSIDFIGLQRLLGSWWSHFGIFEVSTFSEVHFYDGPAPFSSHVNVVPKKTFQYSVTPSSTSDWVIFISDNEKVYFSSLHFLGPTAQMKIYNSETGALTSTIDLTKLSR